jgi:hypothetical protein
LPAWIYCIAHCFSIATVLGSFLSVDTLCGFLRRSDACDAFYDSVTGKRLHSRAYSTKGSKTQFGRFSFQDPVGEVTRVALAMKHKYLMPLDAEMRARILPLSKPYPKRTTRTKEQDAVHHTALGGVTPTRALHT